MTDKSDKIEIFSSELLGLITDTRSFDTQKWVNNREEIFHTLNTEAMRCLSLQNVPERTSKALCKAIESKFEWHLLIAFELWSVGMPDFGIDGGRKLFLASDFETELKWGDFLIFPNRREGMTSEMIRSRDHMMQFAADAFITTNTKSDIFKDVNIETFKPGKVRDDMDPEILLQVEIECLLFWWLKMDQIYDFHSENLDVFSGEKRAVLSIW